MTKSNTLLRHIRPTILMFSFSAVKHLITKVVLLICIRTRARTPRGKFCLENLVTDSTRYYYHRDSCARL